MHISNVIFCFIYEVPFIYVASIKEFGKGQFYCSLFGVQKAELTLFNYYLNN